jgi:RNA polymerase sigma-70 factor, ECF subfamily
MADIGGLLVPQLPSLRRYALTLTRDASRADDLVQTCIVRALANQDRWAEGTNLQGWLCTILHNVFVGQLRRDTRERRWRAAAVLEPASMPGSDPELWCRVVELRTALAKLPVWQREVVLRIGLDGDTYDRVAETLGIPLGTVRSRLSRGRQHLRNLADAGPVTWRAKSPAISRRPGAVDAKHPLQSPMQPPTQRRRVSLPPLAAPTAVGAGPTIGSRPGRNCAGSMSPPEHAAKMGAGLTQTVY